MTITSVLEEDKTEIGAIFWQPFKIVILWELIEFFDAGKLFGAVYRLSSFGQKTEGYQRIVTPAQNHEENKELINYVCAELARLDLPTSLASAREVQTILHMQAKPYQGDVKKLPGEWLEINPLALSQYRSHAIALLGRLKDELSIKKVMIFPSNKVGYFDGSSSMFSSAVRDSFVSAQHDMDESEKCFALNRHTACVFHLMRAMEAGLNLLGKDLGVSVGQNWNTALDEIEKEIRSRNRGTHGPQWKIDEPFYSEAATHFRFVKNAWRNYVAHLHESYDEERAKGILNSVSDFMRHLATRLHE